MSNSRSKLLNDVDASMLWQAIKEATAQKTYTLKINLDRVPSVFDSKVGGLPYWDLNVPIPRTSDGKKMALLAQLNMADYPDNDLLPKEGMLQFFISASDVYGLNFDDQTSQDAFRVVFHEKINRAFSPESIKGEFILPHDSGDDDLPIASEYALDVEQKVAYMFEYDYRFDDVIKSVAQSIGLRNRPEYASLSDKEFHRILWDSLEPIFEKNDREFVTSGSRVLGYPFFTQSDPRDVRGKYSGYDILLFQLDSEDRKLGDDSYDWMVMWGDCGVGNFFIRKEALLNKDFSNVLYNWDCF